MKKRANIIGGALVLVTLTACVDSVEEHPMYPAGEQESIEHSSEQLYLNQLDSELIYVYDEMEYRVEARLISQETTEGPGSGNDLTENVESIIVPQEAVVSSNDDNNMLIINGQGYSYAYELIESNYMEMASIIQTFEESIQKSEPNYRVSLTDLHFGDFPEIADFDYFTMADREHENMYMLLKEENINDQLYLHYVIISIANDNVRDELLRTITSSIASINLR
ncbi:hypothetical protein AJ85_01925 [Alkalihalobacillus alcalophilus ATCC 27647 = CGMCC 1.3604]|uniref:Uncharacterized protein n=1 Tax=Alkalihalobacillus alcalophilus ATCC 27647 = CGMCC 1.3604 TaxID=1218173 RepID=A0A094XIU7_ALKAL|nr:hypothetical protein [Alkalihalobacillus alcalophilus]KGA98675.1 hypothetical protein BALCAV_0202675 [Alkalihalobacillus alcalophilus ATCC 27647 = CGMCC 1.3604]MED1560299.1 hypothetical protein [Alkalihalobacillus alcalophilus]THG88621.1 hypothetical protein AJ85_01925 [Alkalihalobacillus alcalophilus ATCC 27647 = CGMCC 1.3604]